MKSISLFSGCGGLDLGFQARGIQPVAFVERDAACIDTLKTNHPHVPVLDNIVAADWSQFVSKRIDVVVGGPPCQSFSTAGKRRGLDDSRGLMIQEYLRCVKSLKPQFLIMENVKGILSFDVDGGPFSDWFMRRASKLGYTTRYHVMNANHYGSPQKRERVIFVGYKNSGQVRDPVEIHPRPVLSDVIRDLEEDVGECASFSKRFSSIMKHVPEGGCWRDLPPRIRDEAMGNATRSSGGLTAFYRRLSYDRPSPTLVTSPTQRATTLCHPVKTRPLSIAEYRRIQGIPDDYTLCGSRTDKYRMLGNAVPVQLGTAIATMLQ
jgi:DNA (cytosine-5)-methyltransferase 1